MNMVERYLGSVAWALPQATREDIISELRDDILSRIEAVEAGSGRAATEAEIATVLRATGHPATVAARYSGQNGLLPPEAVPWWWAHVRALAGLIGVLAAAGAVLATLSGTPLVRAVVQAFAHGAGSFLQWLGVLTLVYLVFARHIYPRTLASWNPARLPPVTHEPSPHMARFANAIGLVLGVACLLWWTGAVRAPRIPDGLQMGPALQQLYWPILVLLLLGIAHTLVEMFQPARRRLIAVLVLVAAIVAIACASYLLRNRPLVMVVDGSMVARGLAAGINGVGPIALVFVVIGHVFAGWSKARYLLRNDHTAN